MASLTGADASRIANVMLSRLQPLQAKEAKQRLWPLLCSALLIGIAKGTARCQPRSRPTCRAICNILESIAVLVVRARSSVAVRRVCRLATMDAAVPAAAINRKTPAIARPPNTGPISEETHT
jgi:hypothetical protein